VEPLPSSELLAKIKEYNIDFLKGCIYLTNSKIDFYTGYFQNESFDDVSSVHSDWWGVTNESVKLCVPSYTFKYLIDTFHVNAITYLKIDTEGSEWEIIQQLNNNLRIELPKIVQFEYGGGSLKKENKDGWSEYYFNKTIDSLNHLKTLGYNHILLFEANSNKLIMHNLQETDNLKDTFKEEFSYGDILVCKKLNNYMLIILWIKTLFFNVKFRISKRIKFL